MTIKESRKMLMILLKEYELRAKYNFDDGQEYQIYCGLCTAVNALKKLEKAESEEQDD